jgi:hypothetical protein
MMPVRVGPGIALLHHPAAVVEAEQRCPRQRLERAVVRRDECPPVNGRSCPFDDWLPETTLGSLLVGERPRGVLCRALRRTKRVRVERRVRRVQPRDRVDVGGGPRLRPGRRPATRGSVRIYFATSIARLSRMTITFTWPGYSS